MICSVIILAIAVSCGIIRICFYFNFSRFLLGDYVSGQYVKAEPTSQQTFFGINVINDCEGKDAANYTEVQTAYSAPDCSLQTLRINSDAYLVQRVHHGQETVNRMHQLVFAGFPSSCELAYNYIF